MTGWRDRETGLAFVRRIRDGAAGAIHRHIPTIMVSSASQPAHLDGVREAGIQALLQKPFHPTRLVDIDDTLRRGPGPFVHIRTF